MKKVFIPRAASTGAQVRSLINSKALTSGRLTCPTSTTTAMVHWQGNGHSVTYSREECDSNPPAHSANYDSSQVIEKGFIPRLASTGAQVCSTATYPLAARPVEDSISNGMLSIST
jgi:hypothetical protein